MDFRLQTPSIGRASSSNGSTSRVRRSQFAVIMVLAPVNGTFEKKSLVVPFSPDVLKLGRQTTQRSMSSPENGFFDSRVLSRQHAELWADKDTGKVWLKDCKSSNGTYINKQRLSGENTESEPFALNKGDILDLGIDIASDDNASLIYRKISARVERISMIPLHSAVANGSVASVNGDASVAASTQSNGNKSLTVNSEKPILSRNPSLATLKGSNSDKDLEPDMKSGIFGSPLESLALNHVHSQSGLGGMMIKEDVKNQAEFELAAKRLVSQIRSVRVDTAKIKSVQILLEQLTQQAKKHDEESSSREANEVSVAALRAEIDRLRTENAELTAHLHETNKRQAREGTGSANGAVSAAFRKRRSELIFTPPKIHNLVLLLGTTLLMTITGISIMIFFNPPNMGNPPLHQERSPQ